MERIYILYRLGFRGRVKTLRCGADPLCGERRVGCSCSSLFYSTFFFFLKTAAFVSVCSAVQKALRKGGHWGLSLRFISRPPLYPASFFLFFIFRSSFAPAGLARASGRAFHPKPHCGFFVLESMANVPLWTYSIHYMTVTPFFYAFASLRSAQRSENSGSQTDRYEFFSATGGL